MPWLRRTIFMFLISWTLTSLVLFGYHIRRRPAYNDARKTGDVLYSARHQRRTQDILKTIVNLKSSFLNTSQNVINSSSKKVVDKVVNKQHSVKQKLEKHKIIKKPTANAASYKHDNQYLQYMKCPSTLRHKMANHSKLKGKYIADVPILLSDGDITRSEYNRLKNFRDMMGWKSSKFEDIEKALSLLKTPSNRYLFDDRQVNDTVPDGSCIRCAVVGNGGILNGSRIGHVIDSHDYVFRTNVALTKGYEEDVGNKTSFYCFGMKTLSNSIYYMKDEYGFREPPWNPGIRYVFMPEDDWAYRYIYATLTNRTIPKGSVERYAIREPFLFSKPLTADEIKVIHPDFCRYIENSWLRSSKLLKTGRATTGAILIFLALHTCDEVNAFGFMGDPKKYTSHYYDKQFTKSDLKGVAWHDWEAENKLWKVLIDTGVLNIYTRD